MEDKGEIVIYQTQDGITQLDVWLDGETMWITQEQMAQLFERDRTAIGRHISNIFAEGELDKNMVCAICTHHSAWCHYRLVSERVICIIQKFFVTLQREYSEAHK